jgi:hypothetical protein
MDQYMGGRSDLRNKAPGTIHVNRSLYGTRRNEHARRQGKDQHRAQRPAAQRNHRGTGPGIPDEALAPGEELPQPPNDEEVRRIAEKLGANAGERDTLPLEGE